MKTKNIIIVIKSYPVPDHSDITKFECTEIRKVSDADAQSLLKSYETHHDKTVRTNYISVDESLTMQFKGFGKA